MNCVVSLINFLSQGESMQIGSEGMKVDPGECLDHSGTSWHNFFGGLPQRHTAVRASGTAQIG